MEPIFTRYLYERSAVLSALKHAILSKDHDQTLFWVYELVFSGFEQDGWDLVTRLYQDVYRFANPRLEKHFVSGKLEDIALTMSYRSSTVSDESYFVRVSPATRQKYETVETGMVPWKILAHVSKYSVAELPAEWKDAYLGSNWLYYCRNTPIWSRRIADANGRIADCEGRIADANGRIADCEGRIADCEGRIADCEGRIADANGRIADYNKQIVFPTEDDLERFYDKYGLEPDEQSREIHEKHGVAEPDIDLSSIQI